MPGIKVVCPSSPYDAKGLLIAAMEDPDPVLVLEPMRNYRAQREEVPVGKYTVEIGKGKIVREGTDVTLIAWGAMVAVAEKAAEQAKKKGLVVKLLIFEHCIRLTVTSLLNPYRRQRGQSSFMKHIIQGDLATISFRLLMIHLSFIYVLQLNE